jgi:hypothetical protein
MNIHAQRSRRGDLLTAIAAVIVAVVGTAGILLNDFGSGDDSQGSGNAKMITAAAVSRAGAIEIPSEPPAAKADRAAVPGSPGQSRTIALRLDSLADTSILIRMPIAEEVRSRSALPQVIKAGVRKATIACEPVVSVLTEVAKQLQPGRCIT